MTTITTPKKDVNRAILLLVRRAWEAISGQLVKIQLGIILFLGSGIFGTALEILTIGNLNELSPRDAQNELVMNLRAALQRETVLLAISIVLLAFPLLERVILCLRRHEFLNTNLDDMIFVSRAYVFV